MGAWEWKTLRVLNVGLGRLFGGLVAAALASGVVAAQSPVGLSGTQKQDQPGPRAAWPSYVVPGEAQISTMYHDGSQIVVESEGRWSLVCGSNPTGVTAEDLRIWAELHEAAMREGPVTIIDNPNPRGTQVNIVFALGGSVPSGAVPAFAMAEAYLEDKFSDDITVEISVTFGNLDPNVLGSTMVNYQTGISYTNSRAGLVNGMDSDDVIQPWLPTGSSCPARYNGTSPNITQVSSLRWARAAYKAAIGSVSGYVGSHTYNNLIAWDYDPSDGIDPGATSLVDVVIHETIHALGFVSAVDLGTGMNAMDLYRFQLTDEGENYNPDTYADFQVAPRLLAFNSPPDDLHISDLIVAEYRMEDGDPWQASHFRDGSPYIGIMCPTIGSGVTRYPEFCTAADLAMLDAIGWDYPPCTVPQFTQQPQNTSGCVGGTVELTVAVDIPNPGYQWRRLGSPLEENEHYVGTNTATLQIVGLTYDDVGPGYDCYVTNLDDTRCGALSTAATVGAYTPVTISSHPTDKTVFEYSNVSFSVTASGTTPLTYRWRRNGVNLNNGGNIYGATSSSLVIVGVLADQAGSFDCLVTNLCGTVPSNPAQLCVNTGYGAWRGDLNCDGVVSFADINPFILALSSGETVYYNTYPDCHFYNADINCSGTVDFGDINPFVQCIVGGCP
jgi:hypothetical protein